MRSVPPRPLRSYPPRPTSDNPPIATPVLRCEVPCFAAEALRLTLARLEPPAGEFPIRRDDATGLAGRLAAGDPHAAAALFPLVYEELHALAQGALDGQRVGHTLQPTALVNEAYLRLIGSSPEAGWNGRLHFLGVAAKAMRSVLVDHARRKAALKHGGSAERLPLESLLETFEQRSSEVLALDVALEKLALQDPELGRLVELRFFGGLSMEEVAQALDISVPTATRRWRVARMWLRRELGE